MINDQTIKRRAIGYESFWGAFRCCRHQTDQEVPYWRLQVTKGAGRCPDGIRSCTLPGDVRFTYANTEDLEDASRYIEITAYANDPIMTDSVKRTSSHGHVIGSHTIHLGKIHISFRGRLLTGRPYYSRFAYGRVYFANTPFVDRLALSQASVTARRSSTWSY